MTRLDEISDYHTLPKWVKEPETLEERIKRDAFFFGVMVGKVEGRRETIDDLFKRMKK